MNSTTAALTSGVADRSLFGLRGRKTLRMSAATSYGIETATRCASTGVFERETSNEGLAIQVELETGVVQHGRRLRSPQATCRAGEAVARVLPGWEGCSLLTFKIRALQNFVNTKSSN